MRRIVTIIGTDGSGKTTLSTELVGRLRDEGVDARLEWLGAESYLMAPARAILRVIWRKKPSDNDSVEVGYSRDITTKNGLASRFPWAIPLYIFAITLDYQLQLRLKLFRNRQAEVLVADRYLFDVAVNLGLTLGWTPEETIEFAQRQLGRLWTPCAGVFLRVAPEVSMSRKDDIPDINYLRLRFRYYEAIARAFGFVVLDGTRPIAENAEWLVDHVRRECAKPRVHYVHSNNHDVGGADFVLVNMAAHMRHFSSGGAYRTTTSLRLATEASEEHAKNGTPVLLANFVRPQLASGLAGITTFVLRAPGTLWYFRRLFKRERPDVVHVNDLYDFLPAIAARSRKIPVVYHIRMIKSGAVRRGFAWLLPRVSTVTVSVSDAVRRTYFPEEVPDHAVVIHDLGKTSLVEATGDQSVPRDRVSELRGPGRLVVMLGRIEEWKGQHVFIEAVRKLPDAVREHNTFALIGGGVPGKGGYFERVTVEASELGIICLGTRSDSADLLLAADVSVHASIQPDPFPGVVIESLLAGAATLATRAGGVPEMINSPEVGVLYEPGDSDQLARTLRDVLEDPRSPRERYSRSGRARALRLVDATTVDRAVDEVYRSVRGATPAHARLALAHVTNDRN